MIRACLEDCSIYCALSGAVSPLFWWQYSVCFCVARQPTVPLHPQQPVGVRLKQVNDPYLIYSWIARGFLDDACYDLPPSVVRVSECGGKVKSDS